MGACAEAEPVERLQKELKQALASSAGWYKPGLSQGRSSAASVPLPLN